MKLTDAVFKFWRANSDLRRAAYDEFLSRQPEYGDAWLDLDVEALCGTVRGEANRLRPEMSKLVLRQRIVDVSAYLAMLYRLTEES